MYVCKYFEACPSGTKPEHALLVGNTQLRNSKISVLIVDIIHLVRISMIGGFNNRDFMDDHAWAAGAIIAGS